MGGLTPVLEFNKMRKNIVVGNWKMNLNRTEAIDLVEEVLSKLKYPEAKELNEEGIDTEVIPWVNQNDN